MTHDYKRHGTTTLFAAMELGQGEVIATCMRRHRHQEWIKFLKMIDEQTPQDLDLHVIVDNYATHKHEKVQRWLKHHPRFHMHLTPTSSSWLNIVEGVFRSLDEKRLRRDAFRSVPQLVNAIMGYIEGHNDDPKPIIWTKAADEILAKVGRARAKLDKLAIERITPLEWDIPIIDVSLGCCDCRVHVRFMTMGPSHSFRCWADDCIRFSVVVLFSAILHEPERL
jgi:hypothetical protein